MKFRFTPEMFNAFFSYPAQANSTGAMAALANQALDAHLAALPKVYISDQDMGWRVGFPRPESTHSGVIFNIEELPKKECEHEPLFIMDELRQAFVPFKCGKCGVRLKSKWEAE